MTSMRERRLARRALVLPVAIVSLCVAGCGGPSTVPSADAARTALEQALDSWKSGAAPGPVAGTKPSVQAIDSAWRGGRKLKAFEILREEPTEDAKRFIVRRRLEGTEEPQEAAYVVFGAEPIWVYAEDDYRRLTDMDNNPPTDRKGGRRR